MRLMLGRGPAEPDLVPVTGSLAAPLRDHVRIIVSENAAA